MQIKLMRDGSRTIDSVIYKYAAINQNLYSLLVNSELWFSNPLDFNDPYDCNLNYDFSDISEEGIYQYFKNSKNAVELYGEHFLKNRAKTLVGNIVECERLGIEFLKNTVEGSGVCCFSEQDDILLMWSHYANCHKGVCLTFDIGQYEKAFSAPFKVNYPGNYPRVNPFNNYGNEVQLLLATKSQEWAYEKEIRIIKNINNSSVYRGAMSFQPEALTEIKFGYKASNEDIKTIKSLVATKYPHVKLYRSKIKTGEFGLEFNPI